MVLEIVITGLVALVRDSCDAGKTKAMNVVMMKGHAGMEHKPRLVIDAKYVEPTTVATSWPTEAMTLTDGTQLLVWDLTGYRLEIVNAPKLAIYEGHRKAKTKRQWESETPDFKSHPASDPPEDISWLPDLDRSCAKDPGTLIIDKDAGDPSKLPSYATARLMTLEVTEYGKNGDNWLEAGFDLDAPRAKTAVFRFDDEYRQLMADSARVQLAWKLVDKVVLKLVSIATNEERVITVRMAGTSDVVPISISNLPTQHLPYTAGDPIHHFEAYFDLLKDPNDKRTCHVPAEPVGLHIQPVKCTLCVACGPGPD